MVLTTPSQLVLKLFWDRERPASSDFASSGRKKFAETISGD
jgi:hypothetical protein